MLPHLGAGAAQGIEDAYLLAQLLSCSQTALNNVEVRKHHNIPASGIIENPRLIVL